MHRNPLQLICYNNKQNHTFKCIRCALCMKEILIFRIRSRIVTYNDFVKSSGTAKLRENKKRNKNELCVRGSRAVRGAHITQNDDGRAHNNLRIIFYEKVSRTLKRRKICLSAYTYDAASLLKIRAYILFSSNYILRNETMIIICKQTKQNKKN